MYIYYWCGRFSLKPSKFTHFQASLFCAWKKAQNRDAWKCVVWLGHASGHALCSPARPCLRHALMGMMMPIKASSCSGHDDEKRFWNTKQVSVLPQKNLSKNRPHCILFGKSKTGFRFILPKKKNIYIYFKKEELPVLVIHFFKLLGYVLCVNRDMESVWLLNSVV